MWRQIAVQPRAAWLHVELELARRGEARALALAGDAACGGDAAAGGAEIAGARAAAFELRKERDAVRRAAAASLDEDRADWATASAWLKLLVVARGLLVRAALRARERRIARDLAPILREIGAHVLGRAAPAQLPGHVVAAAAQRRRRAEDLAARRVELLAPFGGHALPSWASAGARELSRVALGVARELRSRLLPRLPGLAGLAAGWWVAQSFTASRWAAFSQRLGLRHGGPRVVTAETYERLEFWAPLLAAAACAYAGSRVWALLERRYGGEPAAQRAVPEPRTE
jgi:hypothetical protein